MRVGVYRQLDFYLLLCYNILTRMGKGTQMSYQFRVDFVIEASSEEEALNKYHKYCNQGFPETIEFELVECRRQEMTFEQFMEKVNQVVAKYANGLTADDFADACWHDLYEDVGEDVDEEDIIELLSEADDIFAQMVLNVFAQQVRGDR